MVRARASPGPSACTASRVIKLGALTALRHIDRQRPYGGGLWTGLLGAGVRRLGYAEPHLRAAHLGHRGASKYRSVELDRESLY